LHRYFNIHPPFDHDGPIRKRIQDGRYNAISFYLLYGSVGNREHDTFEDTRGQRSIIEGQAIQGHTMSLRQTRERKHYL
jgi:hypothetical protein